MAEFLNGWGRGTWGQLGFGEGSVPLEITAPAAGSAGTPVAAVNAQAIASIGGVTASLGSISVVIQANANVTPATQLAAANLGTATTTSVNNISVDGLASTSALGTTTLSTNNNLSIFGQDGEARLGDTSLVTNNSLTVSGFGTTSALGTATTTTVNNVFITGLAGTSALGSVTTVCKANTDIIGLLATGSVNDVLVWGLVDDTQTPNWEEVA